MGLPPFVGFAGKICALIPVVSGRVPALFCLSVGVVAASAGYLMVSIGALLIALGAGSWAYGLRFAPVLIGLSVVSVLLSAFGAVVFFLL